MTLFRCASPECPNCARAEQAYERDRDATCPGCRKRDCECEVEHFCGLCGEVAIHMVVTASIGGERDEVLYDELWLCEECEEREDQNR